MLQAFIQSGLIATPEARKHLAEAVLSALLQQRSEAGVRDKGTEHALPAVDFVLGHGEVQRRAGRSQSQAHLAAGLLLGFVRDAQQQLDDLGHPHQAEQALWDGVGEVSENEMQAGWPAISFLLKSLYGPEEIDLAFFEKKWKEPLKEEARKALRELFLEDWNQLIDGKRIAYQTDRVNSWRDDFLARMLARLDACKDFSGLLDQVRSQLGDLWEEAFDQCLSECAMNGQCSPEELLSALQRLCQSGCSMSHKLLAESLELALRQMQGKGWGGGEGYWLPDVLQRIQRYERTLRNDPELQRLIEIIGRGSGKGRPSEIAVGGQTLLPAGSRMIGAQRGEITGSRESGDLHSLLPSELSLFSQPDTEALFLKKMAEQRLQTLEYQSLLLGDERQLIPARETEGEAEEQGPIIVCLDTSGSMAGPRERYAKLATYCLAKTALEENRLCQIISFSRDIRVLEVSRESSIRDLLDFLAHSFHGGTDPSRALLRAANLMQARSYRWADLLMISDFQMQDFRPRILEAMEQCRARHNRFYALLTCSDMEIDGPLRHFDKVWREVAGSIHRVQSPLTSS